MRRVVTGPGLDRRATIVQSGPLVPIAGMAGSRNETRLCWATSGPVTLPFAGADPLSDDIAVFPAAGETRFLLLTFAANSASPLHTTPTTDYVVVISGQVWLVLEDGSECQLSAGDTVVQNGTVHAWQNRSSTPCTIAATMIGAAPAPGLTDMPATCRT